MSTYEIIRCIGILVGPTFALVMGGIIAWVVRVERRDARREAESEALFWLYRHNIPDLWTHVENISARQGVVITRPSETREIATLADAVKRAG